MSLEAISATDTSTGILFRFAFNLVVQFVLIRLIYYRFERKEEYVFSFFLMGIIIFLLCSLLMNVNIQLGMALGLFAVFAILRFRTVNYTAKDMTYIFTVIGISVINSQANLPPPVIGALIVNSVIIISAMLLEIFLKKNFLTPVTIIYNKLNLLNPELKEELLADLAASTGLNVEKVRIKKIDIAKCNAEIEVFFRDGTRPLSQGSSVPAATD
ncbi:MAG TPA: DUF4956 domain-containing protein [Bacteroidales bacterium]|nr:DUF4956 domain-containing protein [Bacteroidales bacterium]